MPFVRREPLNDFECEEVKRLSPEFPPQIFDRVFSENLPYVLPSKMDMERIKNMKIFEDDLWIITPPKCGTTWTQVNKITIKLGLSLN